MVVPLEMVVVAVDGVVVDTGEGVVVEANNVRIVLSLSIIWKISPGVKSVVTCALQQTTARNPFAFLLVPIIELNFTVMVSVLVKGPGMEAPQ